MGQFHDAQKCVNHFHGCQWDASGGPVVAYILEATAELYNPMMEECAAQLQFGMSYEVSSLGGDTSASIPAYVPVFQPYVHTMETPSWTPAPELNVGASDERLPGLKERVGVCSETSTEMGESESADD